MAEREGANKLRQVRTDVHMALQELSPFGNPHHAMTYLKRAKAVLDMLEWPEGVVDTPKMDLKDIPQSSNYCANRYDTDDKMVLHLWCKTWDGREVSYDLTQPKTTAKEGELHG